MSPLCASPDAGERFTETAWSVVIAAGATTEPRAHAALTELDSAGKCRISGRWPRFTPGRERKTWHLRSSSSWPEIKVAPLDYGDLKLDPDWDLLRSDPRFEKIVASLAPKQAF